MSERSVIVIGGGAAGLIAAVSAARNGTHVTVLEAAKRVGQKILRTGNGRCNLTNLDVSAHDYNDPAYVEGLLERYPADVVLEFFESIGLLAVEEDEGRMYPLSNTASSVLDVLREACVRLGVTILCEQEAIDIRANDEGYAVACADGAMHGADCIIVCTGGASRLLGKLGHAIDAFQPVLCPVKTTTQHLKGLSGTRAQAVVAAFHDGEQEPYFLETGEVLFRDYGLSGIVIFDLSRFAQTGDLVQLDFIPGFSIEEYSSWLNDRYAWLCNCGEGLEDVSVTCADLLCGSFHPRLNNAIARVAGLKPSQPVRPEDCLKLAHAAKSFRVEVMGLGDAKQAQVTRGGAATKEFDPLTLESSLAPGVFAAGETLNVDGRCGGFNLHWAWASGLAAGAASAGCEE